MEKSLLENFEISGDSSPSLRNKDGELMHHSAGAWSETLYVYYPVLELLEQYQLPLRAFVLGTGLGYIDFMIGAYFLQKEKENKEENWILSFEKEKILREGFASLSTGVPHFLFEQVLSLVSSYYKIPAVKLISVLSSIRTQKEDFQLEDMSFYSKPNCIFFDFYSAKTDPIFWTEEFLKSFLSKVDDQAIFATYASKSILNKALKSAGFKIILRPGFSGKREMTLAIRGI